MDHPVPLTVEIPEVHGVVSSGTIPVWALHIRTSEVEIEEREGSINIPRWFARQRKGGWRVERGVP